MTCDTSQAHNIETQNKEEFQFTMAHTGRFYKSFGIQLLHYLNLSR